MIRDWLDLPRAGEFLSRRLPALQPGRDCELLGLSVLDVAVRDSWVVQYSVALRDTKRLLDDSCHLACQRFRNGDLERAASSVRKQSRRALARLLGQPLQRWVLELPEEGLLIYPFPLDPKIRNLHKAMRKKSVARLFREAGYPVRSCARVEPLRYVPSKRCQLRYTFRDREGKRTAVLGKVYRDDRGRRVYRGMEMVADLYARRRANGISAPRPLAFLDGWNMLVQESAPGETLNRMIFEGTARERHLASAAHCLALLHSGCVESWDTYRIPDETRLIEQSVSNLRTAGLAGDGFERVLGDALCRIPLWDDSREVPVHRDFHDKQLLISGDRTALIDLDTLALGPAEIDVANFLVHLRLRSLQGGVVDVDAWERLFLAEYARQSGRALDAELLRFFRVTAFLRLACKYRLHARGEELAAALLLQATRALRDRPAPARAGSRSKGVSDT